MMRFIGLLWCGIACGLPSALRGQAAQLDPGRVAAFHAHVADLLAAARVRYSGDTTAAWTERGPVLYFVASVAGDTVRSVMAREDGLVGSAESIWENRTQKRFEARWTRNGTPQLTLAGRIVGNRLLISGTRDTAFAIPDMPWLVADYGLEDQLLPAIKLLGAAGGQIAVLRPYPMRWDTLSVTSRELGGYLVIESSSGPRVRETFIVDAQGHLLLLRRHDTISDRRPLEGTGLFLQYERALERVQPGN